VQCVGRLDEQPVSLVGPARIGRVAVGQGRDLLAGEGNSLGEERHVHSPLVLTLTARAGPVDDDLAVTHRQREPFAELIAAPAAHGGGHRKVPHERPEQQNRRRAGRHHGFEPLGDVARVRRVDGIDPGRHRDPPVLVLICCF
jgi:hypothetical protein